MIKVIESISKKPFEKCTSDNNLALRFHPFKGWSSDILHRQVA